jgi:endonuclease/exonuclease/phosphatase family metal-dependent hydrolase
MSKKSRMLAGMALLAFTLTAWGYGRMGTNHVELGNAGGGVVPAVSQEAVEFDVVSYNVQCRPWFDDAAEKLPQLAPLLAAYDVVAVQECFQRYDLLVHGAGHPHWAYFGRLYRPWKLANAGLATLSRLPVDAVVFHHFGVAGELQDRVASKGIVLTRLRAGGHTVDLYNTHMEAGHSPSAQAARMDQARQVVTFVSEHSPATHSVIITGDFNMNPPRPGKTWTAYTPCHAFSAYDMEHRTAAFAVLQEGLGLRDAYDTLEGPVNDDIERFLFRAGLGHTLEPIFTRVEGEAFRRPDGSSLSDGSPKVARFRVAPATPSHVARR